MTASWKQLKEISGRYQSGQMGQTVNLLAYAFGGSNPSLPTMMPVGVAKAHLTSLSEGAPSGIFLRK